ncbi:hypothetical protein KFL_003850020 [Klebsormidium nitens]|uniref:RRM domain-containing protein n=1 Tax=Klebsormidium nitens TaxID=105231 RepID=A0A1Y1IFL6_KLENI|nr:hypothetical protein KFL_003850020 [Klebsormidium nitens]|eukprot:GAQ87881.1 hypothetical protein KFL_003850020 [Klebsormidium nitens]
MKATKFKHRLATEYMQQPSYNAYANYFAAAAALGAQQTGQMPPGAHPMHMHPPQMAPMMLAGYAPVQNTKDNPPCNTLFVGNLSESVLESELRGLFHSQPGFRQMKILRQQNGTTCFVEFMDIPSAMNVHHNLQGAILASSTDKGGMRIQYSKNPYGRKKESPPPAAHDEGQGGEHYRGSRPASF